MNKMFMLYNVNSVSNSNLFFYGDDAFIEQKCHYDIQPFIILH